MPPFRLSPEAATNDTGNRSPSALLTALQHAPGRGEISGGDVLLQNGWFSTIATLNKAKKVTYHYSSGFQMSLFSLSFFGVP